jgi:esterase/lipase superfamily enzyme
MRREHVQLFSPAIGRDMDLIAYGDGGLPVLVIPTSEGSVTGWEDFGMINVLAPLLEADKLRLYCVASHDSQSWYGGKHTPEVPPNERAWRHRLYENWIMNQVVPAIGSDVGDAKVRLTITGCSFGAFHSANFALKHPQRFKLALCMSGVYDIRFLLDGYHDDWAYFNNPLEYVPRMKDDLLWTLRANTFIALVCGQGQWEDRTLDSTRKLWWQLEQKGIPNYMDLWGHDVAHDWPWWRKQIVFFMEHLVEGQSPWPNIKLD